MIFLAIVSSENVQLFIVKCGSMILDLRCAVASVPIGPILSSKHPIVVKFLSRLATSRSHHLRLFISIIVVLVVDVGVLAHLIASIICAICRSENPFQLHWLSFIHLYTASSVCHRFLHGRHGVVAPCIGTP